MQKDFDNWNTRKKEIDEREPNFYYEREIRWCSLGINVGFEQDGTSETYKRPVLIIKGFSRHVCLVVPLTTSIRKHILRVPVGLIEGSEASANVSQIRVVDTRRLQNRIGGVGPSKRNRI